MLGRIVTVAVAAVAGASAAAAADLPSRKAPPAAYVAPAPMFTWTGFFIGLNAGAAIRNNQWGYNYYGAGYWPNNNGADNVGFTGGGQIGYNWQMGPAVLGLEADLNYLSAQNASNTTYYFGASNSTGGLLGTVRGRLGFGFDRWLIYATGGFAYGNAYYNAYYPIAGTPYYWGNYSSGMRVGYTVGGGVEWAIANNWSIKAEYLFTDIRRNNSNWGFQPAMWNRATQNHIVRLGVNYHFNWGGVGGPVVARY
ncbi:MAG: outer membrane beta-barrel protein [Beijerinckiaceae bacterium]